MESTRMLASALLLVAAACGATLKITEPPDGAILNRNDGETVATGLWVTVRGQGSGVIRVNGALAKVDCGLWQARVLLRARENHIVADDGAARDAITVLWDRGSVLRYRVSVDDNIFWLRDIAAKGYPSLFDNPFLAFWQQMHRKYGCKVHFNIFYETEGFNLSQMPDRYKSEWRANADWIRLTFHARAQNPPKPYLNASAQQVVADYRQVTREIERFAGKELLSPVTTIHYGEATREACAALRKEGIKILVGYFYFDTQGKPVVSYYLPTPEIRYMMGHDYWKDVPLDIIFIRHDIVLDRSSGPTEVIPRLETIGADPHRAEIMELLIHEQFFYPETVGYVPDYRERVEQGIQWVTKKGYRPVFYEEGFLGSPR